jgi:hypothetical protein
MQVVEEQLQRVRKDHLSRDGKAALATAAAAAATGAAAYGIRRALSHSTDSASPGEERERRPASILGSAVSSTWESVANALLPLAEEAAETAGRYVAERAPEVVRTRIVPRFIRAFSDAG